LGILLHSESKTYLEPLNVYSIGLKDWNRGRDNNMITLVKCTENSNKNVFHWNILRLLNVDFLNTRSIILLTRGQASSRSKLSSIKLVTLLGKCFYVLWYQSISYSLIRIHKKQKNCTLNTKKMVLKKLKQKLKNRFNISQWVSHQRKRKRNKEVALQLWNWWHIRQFWSLLWLWMCLQFSMPLNFTKGILD
jgi:hypothetical protein